MRAYKYIATTALLTAILITAPLALAESKRVIANSTSTTTVAPTGGISEVNVIVSIPQTQTATPPIKGEDKTPDYVSDAIAITAKAESYMSNTLTLLGLFIAVVTIVVGIIIARGFFSIKAMNDIYKLRDELESLVTKSNDKADRIDALHVKLSEQASAIATNPDKDAISEADRATLDKAASSLEMMEVLGQKLTADDYFSLAYDYWIKGEYQKAIDLYDKTLAFKPDDVEALCNKGATLTKLGKPELAIVEFDKALAFKPDYVEALCNKGATLIKLGKPELAIVEFDKALAFKPDYVNALSNKGVALDDLNKHHEAIVEYDKALAFKPDDVDALSNKGNTLNNLGKHDEAIVVIDKALAIKPDSFEALNNKGVSLAELGKHGDAIVEFDKALAIKPDFANLYFNRACAYALTDKKDEALKDLERAIELDGKYCEKAREDDDFISLKGDPEFRKLVGLDDEGGTASS